MQAGHNTFMSLVTLSLMTRSALIHFLTKEIARAVAEPVQPSVQLARKFVPMLIQFTLSIPLDSVLYNKMLLYLLEQGSLERLAQTLLRQGTKSTRPLSWRQWTIYSAWREWICRAPCFQKERRWGRRDGKQYLLLFRAWKELLNHPAPLFLKGWCDLERMT